MKKPSTNNYFSELRKIYEKNVNDLDFNQPIKIQKPSNDYDYSSPLFDHPNNDKYNKNFTTSLFDDDQFDKWVNLQKEYELNKALNEINAQISEIIKQSNIDTNSFAYIMEYILLAYYDIEKRSSEKIYSNYLKVREEQLIEKWYNNRHLLKKKSDVPFINEEQEPLTSENYENFNTIIETVFNNTFFFNVFEYTCLSTLQLFGLVYKIFNLLIFYKHYYYAIVIIFYHKWFN